MPSISAITPATFDSGRSVTLSGSGFGASQGSILIAGQAQTVTSWSDTSITFTTVRGSQSQGACRVDVVGATGFAHGDAVTITGSGFGTNSAALNFIGGQGEAIESTAIGARPSKAGWNFDAFLADPQAYSDVDRGVVMYLPITDANYSGDIHYDAGSAIETGVDYYFTWWAKANVANAGSPEFAQWKIARVNAVDSITDSDCEISAFKWFGNGNNLYIRRGGGNNTNYFPEDQYYPGRDNVWCRMEMFVSTGTQNVTNGAVHLAATKSGTRSVYSLTAKEIYSTAARHRYFILQNYWGNFNNGGQTNRDTYIDDVGVSVGSWKRVELTDSASLASSTVREFQPWTNWADGSVTIKLNKGGRVAGTYYLHVISGLDTSLGYRQITVV